MAFDFSTLVTDRTQADVAYAKALLNKLVDGTATEAEIAEWNSFTLKGVYNHTDLNRVTTALEVLKAKLESYGYLVPGYEKVKITHPTFGGGSNLPDDYIALEYIQSTGTQYIDTGFKPNNNTGIEIKFNIPSGFSDKTELFGARNSSTYFELLFYAAGSMYLQFGSQLPNKSFVPGDFDLKLDGGKLYDKTNGSLLLDASAAGTFQINQTLYLFAMHNASGGVERQIKAKLYSCQIYDNGTLVRDYVPCINPNGEVGLYDTATKSFFGNSGTGSFVAGAIPRKLPEGYTQVAYIESTGSQYINSNYTPTGTTTMKATVLQYAANANAEQAVFGHSNSGFEMGFGTTNQVFLYSTASASYKSPNTVYDVVFDMTGTVSETSPYKKLIVSLDGGVEATSTAENNSKWKDGVITLFALKGRYNFTGRLYCASIYDSNNVCVRDFVPCKNSGGVIGLYDLANDVFYQNAGTGTFAAGEEVPAPSTASVMVVSGDVTEYDPYTWYEFDWPTPEAMTVYLLNISVIRSVFAVMGSTPTVPPDMEKLMVQEANDIEQIVLDVYRQITIMPTTFIPCGEALCGGDNL